MKGMLWLLTLGVLVPWTGQAAEEVIKWEAEEVIVNKEALRKDREGTDFWTYWTTDKDAEKKWSGCGIVIRSPFVKENRSKPEEGAPPLHIVIPLPDSGPWDISVCKPGRPIGVSRDGKTFQRLEGVQLAKGFVAENGRFEIWFDDMFAADEPAERGWTYLDYFLIKRAR